MFLPMEAQGLVLLQSILLGAGIGLYYDVLRALRRQCRAGRALTALLDALFWCGVLAAFFVYGITLAAGQSRYFVLAGAAAGAGAYFLLISFAVLAAFSACFSLLRRARDMAARTAKKVKNLLRRLGLAEKIKECAKKFGKTPSIFRGKGLK